MNAWVKDTIGALLFLVMFVIAWDFASAFRAALAGL